MPAYAIAILSETRLNDEIRAYLGQIDATLIPYGGEYIIHGGPYQWKEGEPKGDLIAIRFPDLALATSWYESAAYQAIKTLRTANSVGSVFLVPGVPPGHRAADILA